MAAKAAAAGPADPRRAAFTLRARAASRWRQVTHSTPIPRPAAPAVKAEWACAGLARSLAAPAAMAVFQARTAVSARLDMPLRLRMAAPAVRPANLGRTERPAL